MIYLLIILTLLIVLAIFVSLKQKIDIINAHTNQLWNNIYSQRDEISFLNKKLGVYQEITQSLILESDNCSKPK